MALTPKQINAGSSALFSGLSALENYDAAKDIEAIGDYNARLAEEQTEEQVRRMEQDQTQRLGLAQARAAASGASGATTDAYMNALAVSGKKEVDWLKKVGASRYDQALAEARTASNKAMSNFWGDLGSVGTAIAELI
jgi:hypothetical protein